MSQPVDEPTPAEGGRMSIIDHLGELRRRLISSLVAVGVCTLVTVAAAPYLFEFLRLPLARLSGGVKIQLQVLTPIELFLTYLKLSILAGLFLAAPWVLLQIWFFVSPGLYRREKKWIVPFVVLGTLFFVGGGAFAFFVVLPIGFKYLITFTPQDIANAWTVEGYFGIVIRLLLAFGVIFEVPLLMWILGATGAVAPKTFSRFRKYWIVLAWIIAAILTPPDPVTQTIMAIPLMLFFEIGLIGARILYRRNQAPPKPT
jgi:sec-independent protein translocase protein TatC